MLSVGHEINLSAPHPPGGNRAIVCFAGVVFRMTVVKFPQSQIRTHIGKTMSASIPWMDQSSRFVRRENADSIANLRVDWVSGQPDRPEIINLNQSQLHLRNEPTKTQTIPAWVFIRSLSIDDRDKVNDHRGKTTNIRISENEIQSNIQSHTWMYQLTHVAVLSR
jgi:hypothetical protein